jgi:glycosyltransferase involved in cell wall biosynthesis
MRILHATIRYYPALGGVEEYVKRIAEGLVNYNHDVCVYTSDLLRHTDKLVKTQCKNEMINGVRVVREYALPLKLRHYSLMPRMPFDMLGEKADLIHGHCFMSFPLDVASVVAKLKRKKFVFNPYFSEFSPSSILGRLYRKTLGNLAMHADVVVVISEFEKMIIEKAGFKIKRFEEVPPGIDMDEFKVSGNNICNKYGLEGKRVILFAGRLDYNKGIDVLVRAAPIVLHEYPEAIFFIAGADFGELENLKRICKEYSVEKNFIFSGGLERQDLISAFKNAYLFAFPSRYEAFGITLIEAMAAKLAVVASDSTAIPFVVEDGKTGILFPQDDYKALAERIIYLFKNDRQRDTIAMRGHESVLQKYSWNISVNKIAGIYNSL